MNILESQWLGQRLAKVPDDELFPILNIGCSTLEFRTQTQPYIDQNIFAPLRARGGKVIHLDIKAAPGVDMVGDLLDPAFLHRISQMHVRTAMISNLFEHVTVREEICNVVMRILPPGGHVFVSGPYQYPYHADPIDTLFRPTVAEMHGHFPGTGIVDSAIIDSGNWRQWNKAERGRPLGRALARLFLPFYRPVKWLEVVRQTPYVFRHITAFAVVLRKSVPEPPRDGGDAARPTGLVIIGRNEGARLRRCLESTRGRAARTVYVDSGSTDGSVALAESMDVDVVRLDTTVPFTAARARNAGVRRLLELAPDTRYVQFVDGDCEVDPTWWDKARARLEQRPDLAVVCGRRRERFPEQSVYNRMCDLEWNTPVGDANECGGDSMMRRECFDAVGGFDPSLIAGEEPELCLRFRQKGWRVERIDAEMTLHDAAMTRVGQWWQREKRTGYACAEGAARFGNTPERFRVREARRNWFWGFILPLLVLAPLHWSHGWSLLLLLTYPIQWLKLYRFCRARRLLGTSDARVYTTFCVLAKFPQLIGQLKYLRARLLGRPSRLIEYKGAAQPADAAAAAAPAATAAKAS
jgi:glycosyltransferase involved in cell wall biosynthesis